MSAVDLDRMAATPAPLPAGLHHAELHPLDRLSRWVTGHRRAVFVAWAALVLLAAPLAITLNGALSGAGWDASGSESEAVRTELRTHYDSHDEALGELLGETPRWRQ